MALMSCPDCEGKVSDRAYWCPHCGFPVREYIESLENNDSEFEADVPSMIEQADGQGNLEDPSVVEYLDFLNTCNVGNVSTAMAIRMILEMREKPKMGYTLGQIAAMDFNRYENTYILGIETISNIVYHACLRGILEPEYINVLLIDEQAKELQNVLQERLRLSYTRRDGFTPVIVGFAGDRYSITERGMVLANHVLANWFASELEGKPVDWIKWCECYENYIKKYDMYDDSLFADMYIDNKIFEIINREEVVFFKNLEKHILEVKKIELKEYKEEERHYELLQALRGIHYDMEYKIHEATIALGKIYLTLANGNRLNAPYTNMTTRRNASVLKRGIVGGMVAGPTGAVIGAISAVDKNLHK